MSNSTTRLALLEPVGSDSPSALRVSITNHATTLDGAVRVFEGTISNRSTVTPVYGDTYYATDTAQWFRYDGTSWYPTTRLYRTVSSTTTLSPGDIALVNGGVTVTLPTPTAGQLVDVAAASGASGSSPVTVSAGSSTINGGGLSGGTSLVLGAPFAKIAFVGTGSSWLVIQGQQDTGWLPLSGMGLNSNLSAGSGFTPAARLQGDRVLFCGSLTTTNSIAKTTTLWTVPAQLVPSVTVTPPVIYSPSSGASSSVALSVAATSGHVSVTTVDLPISVQVLLDNIYYRLV